VLEETKGEEQVGLQAPFQYKNSLFEQGSLQRATPLVFEEIKGEGHVARHEPLA